MKPLEFVMKNVVSVFVILAFGTVAAYADNVAPSTPAAPSMPMTAKTAPEAKDATVPGCPDNYVCFTPEQLQIVINQQIEQTRMNEMTNNPEFKAAIQQYQAVMSKHQQPAPDLKK
jgi:hypothetical protein